MLQNKTMFLIRRKTDGMFYGSREGWTKQLVKARPFKTVGGAKTSRGWNSWKTISTPDMCEGCKNSKYGNWEHRYSERYFYGEKKKISKSEHLQLWIDRHAGRKPCRVEYRMTDKENPLEVVPITMTLME